MPEKTLIANVRPADGETGTLLVASPVVGRVDGAPVPGVYLNPFDPILTVDILNERYTLRLPRDVHGRVIETFVPPALTPVAYNAPLLRLDPRVLDAGATSGARRGMSPAGQDAATAGLVQITSPTEGIFYRRSSPEAAPYVDVGTIVSTGGLLGLVEVMKCFNPITYGGPGYPEQVEIAKILVEDSAEVQFGQPLFWVRPTA